MLPDAVAVLLPDAAEVPLIPLGILPLDAPPLMSLGILPLGAPEAPLISLGMLPPGAPEAPLMSLGMLPLGAPPGPLLEEVDFAYLPSRNAFSLSCVVIAATSASERAVPLSSNQVQSSA